MSNIEKKQSAEPELCVVCRNFWGSQQTLNMCSLCYKTHEGSAKSAEQTVDAGKKETTISNASDESRSAKDELDAALEEKSKDVCGVCNKKLRLAPYGCKCKGWFCAKHVQPEYHDCTYDFCADNQNRLKAVNQGVIAKKLEEI